MKRFTSCLSLLLVLAMLLSLCPTMAVSAAKAQYYPTTWEELRDALQASGEAEVIVSEDVVIERTFDVSEHMDDVKIIVNGKKTLKLFGEIRFHNSLTEHYGLFNLNDENASLNITGYSGRITYNIDYEQGLMFLVTAGQLILGGNNHYIVDYMYEDNRLEKQQAVVGGTGGTVIVDYGFLEGNTIFGDGIDFVFKNGSIKGVYEGTTWSYMNLDLYMKNGSATFEGCAFHRGISISAGNRATLTMAEDAVCVDLYDDWLGAGHSSILFCNPCAFYRVGFSKLEPAMPPLATQCELGAFGRGETDFRIEAHMIKQNTGLGTTLIDYATMTVLRDGEIIIEEEIQGSSNYLSCDFSDASPGSYEVWIDYRLEHCGVKIRSKFYRYLLTVLDDIGHVNLTLDKTDMNSLESAMDCVEPSDITWQEKSKTGDVWTDNPATLRDGYTYAVEFDLLSIGGEHDFRAGYTVSVNGQEATSLGDGRWRYEYVKTGYLTRIEMYDIMLPAPGQHPDFTGFKGNPPYCSYEIKWQPYIDGEFGDYMTADDTFASDTTYLLEVEMTADDGFEFDYLTVGNGAYAYINDMPARVYYPYLADHSVASAYIYYNTSYCISEVEVADVQYPIPGKTPDNDVVVQSYGVDSVAYSSGSSIDWYYETNPGTSAAGFSRLDGRFKSDRRHQAYVTLEAQEDYWFATDEDGKSVVKVTFDGEPMAFAYATDADSAHGCGEIEAAITFEQAKDVDGVFVDGMHLEDGEYLSSAQWGVQTEGTVNKENGYAYYNDGVLTLHDFEWETRDDYDGIDSYRPLTIRAEGSSHINSSSNGIVTNDTLVLEGDGTLTLESRGEGIFAMGDITVESGTWTVTDTVYDGLWLYSDLTMNGGTLNVFGPSCGINGDDFPTVTINGGTLIAECNSDPAIGWCNTVVADNADVTVAAYGDANATPWDGVTDFSEYKYVKIEVPTTLLGDVNGDGKVNVTDSVLLFAAVSGRRTLTETQQAAADMSGDGKINIADSIKLFKQISGR